MARTKKQLVTAATTFTVALGIGTAMQYGEAFASRWGADMPVAGPDARLDADTVIIPVVANMAVPMVLAPPTSMPTRTAVNTQAPAEELTLAAFDDISIPDMTAPSASDMVLPAPVVLSDEPVVSAATPARPSQQGDGIVASEEPEAEEICNTTMTATPTDLAMVTLDIQNTCRPLASLAIHHQGMMFDVVTDNDGRVRVDVPALREEAFFIAAYDDGEGAVAMTGVPSLAQYDRAVLQWQGEEGVQLHALEFGAGYGSEGHVWSEANSERDSVSRGEGGFLTRLGNDAVPMPLLAEVYTFPSGFVNQDGSVALSVEAEVTARNCGREISAQSLQVLPGEDIRAIDLTMTMPDCDAVGEFLVLKNMFEDLTLASK